MLTRNNSVVDVRNVSWILTKGRRLSDTDLYRTWAQLLDEKNWKVISANVIKWDSKVLQISWKWKNPPREIYIWEWRSIVWIGKWYAIIHDEFTEENTCMNYRNINWCENNILLLLDTEH